MEGLSIRESPALTNARMVLGFTGWMDGGNVSTGTIGYLRRKLKATKFAEIDAMGFYILNFPIASIPITVLSAEEKTVIRSVNPMEFAALFRPHTNIEDGLVKSFTYEKNEFFYSQQPDVILFQGEEPHIRWAEYCDYLFAVADKFGVKELYFVGSVASPVPHTREPKIHASASREELKARLAGPDIAFTNYEGPASIVTFLTKRCSDRGMDMINLVADIPHYPFLDMPTYPRGLLKVVATLKELLHIEIDVSDLEEAATRVQEQLNKVMADSPEFQQLVRRLEEAYDYQQAAADEAQLRRLIDGIDLGDGHDEP